MNLDFKGFNLIIYIKVYNIFIRVFIDIHNSVKELFNGVLGRRSMVHFMISHNEEDEVSNYYIGNYGHINLLISIKADKDDEDSVLVMVICKIDVVIYNVNVRKAINGRVI